MKIILILIMVGIYATCTYADWLELEKITGYDTDYYDYFGNSVSISGDYAVIGAPYDDDNGPHSGSAYIFFFDGVNWTEQAKLTASDGAEGDQFGYSVSTSNGYAVIGAWMDDDNGDRSGSAYIFFYDGSNWIEQAKLIAGDGFSFDHFGNSVSIWENYVVIGAVDDDDNGDRSGSAYVFNRSGTSWIEQTKLTASDGTSYDKFGYSVSISENYAIIGNPCDDDDSGSAYIFEYTGISWIEQVKLTASDTNVEDFFGIAVSISGVNAVIGAPCNDDSGYRSGSAYIFTYDGINWGEQNKLTASDGSEHDMFGLSVSIKNEQVLIGSLFDDNGYSLGSAYVFEPNGSDWIENAKIIVDTTSGSFSKSLSIDENFAIIGAPTESEYAEAAGAAFIFYNEVVSVNDDTSNSSLLTANCSNYPNPFNPSTTISFTISNEQNEQVELVIYNLKGQKVRTFIISSSTDQPINSVTWNGTDQNNQPVSSGIYLYKLKSGEYELSKKMLLLK